MEVEEKEERKGGVKIEIEHVLGLFPTFLLFFCQGLDTHRIQVQSFCLRNIIILLSVMQQKN